MGRHRRVTATATTTHPPQAAPPPSGVRYGRHRGTPRRPAPVRTGLLGASAALAVGAVAVSSGLIPGPGGTFTVGDTRSGDRVQADGAGELTPRGGSASPTDRASRSAGRGDLRDGSASPSEPGSRSPEKQEADAPESRAASPSDTAEPSRTPSATDSAQEDTGGGTPARTRSTETGTGAGGTGDGSGSGSGTGSGSGQETSAEARVLSLVNAERAKAGCAPLTADPDLAALAESHSEDMAERDYFSHTTPDGRSPWDRAAAAGVENLGAENIARGQADAEAVMAAWMNSDGHRANILNCDLRTLGVGAHFAQGGPWWTQAFGY